MGNDVERLSQQWLRGAELEMRRNEAIEDRSYQSTHCIVEDGKSYHISAMSAVDVSQVVEVHLRSFLGFFLSFLGSDFLGLLYRGILVDPCGIGLVCVSEQDGRIAGFVAGVTQQAGFYTRLIQNQKWAFAKASLGAVVRCPFVVPRLLRALKRPKESSHAGAEACLMSLAVRPEDEGKGLGKELVEEFCRQVVQRGAPAVCLTTDRQNNDRVNQFYLSLGFQLHRTYITAEGRGMNEYVRHLNRGQA